MRRNASSSPSRWLTTKLIIADRPTTALDVTIQAQILDLIEKAQAETGAAVMMITHDMGVVARTADDVMVMYLKQVLQWC